MYISECCTTTTALIELGLAFFVNIFFAEYQFLRSDIHFHLRGHFGQIHVFCMIWQKIRKKVEAL